MSVKKILLAVLLCVCVLFTGCDRLLSAFVPEAQETRYEDGRLGDTLTNIFFSFCVNDAYMAESFETQLPTDGSIYLVADITVKNISGEELPMFSSDFQAQWDDEAEDAYSIPIEQISDTQMMDEFTMKKGETVTALCVFEVPLTERETEYSISYQEVFENGAAGDVFFVYFDLFSGVSGENSSGGPML